MKTDEFYGVKYLIRCEDRRWNEFYKLHHNEEENDDDNFMRVKGMYSYTYDDAKQIIKFVRKIIRIHEREAGVHEFTLYAFHTTYLDYIEKILNDYSIDNDVVTDYIKILRQGAEVFKKYMEIGTYANADFESEIDTVNIRFYKYFDDFIIAIYGVILRVQQESMRKELCS